MVPNFKPQITLEDLKKIDIRVSCIQRVSDGPGSDKLMKLVQRPVWNGSKERCRGISRRFFSRKRFSGCSFPDHRCARLGVEATVRWGVRPATPVSTLANRYWYGCRYTLVASRPASPPTSLAAHKRSSRGGDSCYPLPRHLAQWSNRSRTPWSLVGGSRRYASCLLGVQSRESRASLELSTRVSASP
jgi:hypothetical protein